MGSMKKFSFIIKGGVIAYVISFLLILIYSALLVYTSIPESTIPTYTFVISIVSVFISSSLIGIKAKENGLKIGGLIGFVYIIFLYIISSATSAGFTLNSHSIATIIFNILLGMVGGVVGVNLAK